MDQIRQDEHGRKIYEPDGAVLTAYLIDRSPVSIIRGPIGSGTSTASMQKMFQIACEQPADAAGIKPTRWLVVRDSYPALETTTLKTWLYWFPEDMYGTLKRSKPLIHAVRVGNVEMEVVFLSLDEDDAVGKVRSLEITGAFFNELEFIEKAVFNEVMSRCGRFPPKSRVAPKWSGVIADLNAPGEDHWFPAQMGETPPPEDVRADDLSEYVRPKGWCYLVQPPALIEEKSEDGKTVTGYRENPKAENRRWLPDGYYENQVKGKPRSWIDSRLMNRIVMHVEGRRVWPEFVPETHVALQPLEVVPGHTVFGGGDFGRSAAWVFGQCINDRWFIQHELCVDDMPTSAFAPMVKRFIQQHYAGCTVRLFGDPKGRDRGQNDDKTAYQIYASHGMFIEAAPVKQNNIKTRIDTVATVLNEMREGKPRMVVSPACRRLKVGMAGGYHYRKIQGTQRYSEEPEKNRHSHVCDALQYQQLGAGEGRAMQGFTVGGVAGGLPQPVVTRRAHSRRRISV